MKRWVLDTRETVDALADVASVVDVSVYRRQPERGRWRLLTRGEQRTLWSFRAQRGGDGPAAGS